MSIAERSAVGVWGSRTTFVLALTAAAIGFGNLWRFSYLVGEYGGGPFVGVYLATLFLVAVPLMIAEVVIGSHGRSTPVSSVLHACSRSNASRAWACIGWLVGATGLLILSYQSVVAGWSLAYIEKMDSGVFADGSAILVGQAFGDLLGDPQELLKWQTLFIVITFGISALGIHRGLGVVCWFVVPLLLVVLGLLIVEAVRNGDMHRTQEFLFSYNSFDFTAESVLVAMSQALYTLGVGVGVGLAYGAYTPDKIPIGRTVLAVAVLDAAIAIAAGVAIFPFIFSANLEPDLGPGLMFIGLPYAFGNMYQGEMLGLLFFVMVSAMALGTSVALAEAGVSYLAHRLRMRRPLAALVVGSCVWILAMFCALSFNLWQDVHWFGDYTPFELLERVSSDVMLPLGCLLTALFVGYGLKREVLRIEMYRESAQFFFLWRASLRYIAPPAIILVMLVSIIGLV